jgi:hypothetical protein
MPDQRQPLAALFSQVDVTSGTPHHAYMPPEREQNELLREVLAAQDRTNELLEELITHISANHRQRNNELNQWREANPQLAESCREAAEALSRVQVEYLDRMTDEIKYAQEDMIDGEFMLHEFVDRYGPRLAHLNGVIQVLASLSATPAAAQTN